MLGIREDKKALVVSVKIACRFPEELIDGVHYVSIKDDGSNCSSDLSRTS